MANPLREYQTDAVSQGYHVVRDAGGFYIQHPPGMGKSLSAITLARLLKVGRVVIVCPPVAIGVWKREINKWWPEHPRIWSDTTGFPLSEANTGVVIVSYDSLVDPMPAEGKPKSVYGQLRTDMLRGWEPELLLLDEAQYAKSPDSLRARAVWNLRSRSIYCVALSGTPQHNALDLWAQYRMIAPDEPLFARPFGQYKKSLLLLGGPNGNWPMKDKRTGRLRFRPGAEAEIAQAIAPYTHIADSKLLNVPEPVESVVPVKLDGTERKVYQNMENLLRNQFPDGSEAEAEIVLTKLLRLEQIAAGHVNTTDGQVKRFGHSKLDALRELLEEREDQKVIVACRFHMDIIGIQEMLKKMGRAYYTIDGTVKAADRTKAEEAFQSEPGNHVMILQYQAGGVAITLTAAQTMILYTLDPSVIRYRQMIGRVFRIGLDHYVQVISLLAEMTQDEVVYGGLKAGVEHTDLARMMLNHLHRK